MTEQAAEPTIGQSPDDGWEERWVLGFEVDKRFELHPGNIECVLAREEISPSWWRMRRKGTSESIPVLSYNLYPNRYEALVSLKAKLIGRIVTYQSVLNKVIMELDNFIEEDKNEG